MIVEETAKLSAIEMETRLKPVSEIIKLALDQLRNKTLDVNYDEDWQTIPQRASCGIRYLILQPSETGLNAEMLANKIFSSDKEAVLCIITHKPVVVVAKLLSYMAGFQLQRKSLAKLTVKQWVMLIEVIMKLQNSNLLMANDQGWRSRDYGDALTELTNAQQLKQIREAIAETVSFGDSGLLIVATRQQQTGGNEDKYI